MDARRAAGANSLRDVGASSPPSPVGLAPVELSRRSAPSTADRGQRHQQHLGRRKSAANGGRAGLVGSGATGSSPAGVWTHNRDESDNQPEPHRALLNDLEAGLTHEGDEVFARPHRPGRCDQFAVERSPARENAGH
jgi:hypothetical protein